MKGVRFYADLENPGKNDEQASLVDRRTTRKQLRDVADCGFNVNCVAVLLGEEHRNPDYSQEALMATFYHPDSDVSLGGVSPEYLRKCRHIDEALARRLHPRLAARLDSE